MTSLQSKYTKYLFIAPALLIVGALIIYPILYGTYISFFSTNLMQRWNFVGLKNYLQVFSIKDFINSFWITIRFTFFVVLGHFLLGNVLATLIDKPIKARAIFRSILMIPWLFPEIVSGLVFKGILNPAYGIVGYLVQALGFSNEPIPWLSSPTYTFPVVILICIWKGYPFMMLMILAGLQSINPDIYEAARIDGCKDFAAYRYITLPLLMPIIKVALIMDTVSWLKHYNLIAILTDGGPGSTTMLLSNFVYKAAFKFFNFGEASAMAVLIFILCFVVGYIYRRVLQYQEY